MINRIAARPRRREQGRLQRRVNDIDDEGRARQRVERDIERRRVRVGASGHLPDTPHSGRSLSSHALPGAGRSLWALDAKLV